jgi:hypothetical protein
MVHPREELSALGTRIEELDAQLARPAAAEPAPDVDAEAVALRAEIEQFEQAVHDKEGETRGGPGAGMPISQERVAEESRSAQTTLVTCLKRNARLEEMLDQIADPKRIVRKQEAV